MSNSTHPTINDLPDEILRHIISALFHLELNDLIRPRCLFLGRCSRRFRELVSSTLYTTLECVVISDPAEASLEPCAYSKSALREVLWLAKPSLETLRLASKRNRLSLDESPASDDVSLFVDSMQIISEELSPHYTDKVTVEIVAAEFLYTDDCPSVFFDMLDRLSAAPLCVDGVEQDRKAEEAGKNFELPRVEAFCLDGMLSVVRGMINMRKRLEQCVRGWCCHLANRH